MDTTALKAHITKLVTAVEDERFLQSINAMLQAYIADTTLNQEEKTAVDEGLQDVQAERTLTHQQVTQNMKERYPDL